MTRAEAQILLAKLKRYMSGGGVVDRKANEALDMAIKALGEPQWIPCKETLPDEGQDCWITLKAGTVYQGMFTRRYGERRDSGFILNGFSFARLNIIVAWKPYVIPDPWEGEEK